jgi:hypothetical protein
MKYYIWDSIVWYWNLDSLESESEIARKFWNVVLENGAEGSWTIVWEIS